MRTKLAILVLIVGLGTASRTLAQPGLPPRPGGSRPPNGPLQPAGPMQPGGPNGGPATPMPPDGPGGPMPPMPPGNPGPNGGFGGPLTGLTADQLAAFNAGRADFNREETPATGLGPIFNDNSCVRCHQDPAPGGVSGAPRSNVTRFGQIVNGRFDAMEELGGSLLQARSIDPAGLETVPAAATVRATRITTPVFGAGLIDAIPDATIRANANVVKPDGVKPDGVKGRVATVFDVPSGTSRVGRFGWKAQQASLLVFSGDAYLNEVGITNRLFPVENAPNGNTALLAQINTRVRITGLQDQPDPATGLSKIDRVTNFMKFLAPPPVRVLDAQTTAGQTVFQQAGCAVCHTPTMKTGPNTITALNNQDVRLYSDLLLHNMGSLNDGIAQGNAGANEMKTAALWGLNARPLWLHDGRARTIEAAIIAHDGEGAVSKRRFQQLSPTQHDQLLQFLRSL